MEIVTIETVALGDRSYVVVDGATAAVVDPQRDLDRVERVLADRDVRVTHIFETHIHNDYVTGGVELARRTGAEYVIPAGEDVAYEHTSGRDGDEFTVGGLVVRAVHTPGHTPTHLSYVVSRDGAPVAVFTGGSMLYGTVGRTDLIGAEATDSLTRAQFHSVRRLADELPGDTAVHPTHGFGSFCSSAASSGSEESTIATERSTNLAFSVDDEDSFVEELLSGLTAYPRYYAHMAPVNRAGPAPVDLTPPEPVDPAELRRRIHVGEWVVDLRSRTAFARRHLAGTVNIEVAEHFSTYLGWTLRWGTPVTLVGDTVEEVAEAQRQMVRIGIDRPAGAAEGGVEAWGAGGDLRSHRTADFAALVEAVDASEDVVVLDVRRDDEWAEGRIPKAVHIPLHDLEARMDEVPPGEVWVHCASGYRAAIAASLLDRAGRTVVLVDDDWDEADHERLGVTS
jgi:hydroxyacylglutathione hydrolase